VARYIDNSAGDHVFGFDGSSYGVGGKSGELIIESERRGGVGWSCPRSRLLSDRVGEGGTGKLAGKFEVKLRVYLCPPLLEFGPTAPVSLPLLDLAGLARGT
jgi:hypothetical protein